MYINADSDGILRSLRDSRVADDTGYKIPRGGMFEYVSGANFFGEILCEKREDTRELHVF